MPPDDILTTLDGRRPLIEDDLENEDDLKNGDDNIFRQRFRDSALPYTAVAVIFFCTQQESELQKLEICMINMYPLINSANR